MQPNGEQSPTDHRFTVPEAAEALGISPEAVRARIHRGTLRKEKDPDGTVYVRLNVDRSRSNGDDTSDSTPDRSTLEEILRDQVAYLREQLDREREARTEERRRQDTIIAQLTQANASLARRVPELEAPREPRDAPEEPEGDTPTTNGAPQEAAEPRSSWWRRWFGG